MPTNSGKVVEQSVFRKNSFHLNILPGQILQVPVKPPQMKMDIICDQEKRLAKQKQKWNLKFKRQREKKSDIVQVMFNNKTDSSIIIRGLLYI